MRHIVVAFFGLLAVLVSGTGARADIEVETYPIGTFSKRGDPQLADIQEMFKAEDSSAAPSGANTTEILVRRMLNLQAVFAAGYIQIGDIRVVDERCRDAGCSRIMNKVMKRARRAGADLVDEAFTTDRERRETRSGKCLNWTTTTAQEYYCPPIGGASCRYRDVKRPYCLQYETVLSDKVKRERTAHYSFWRHEPELAREAYLAAGLAVEVLKMNKEGVDRWLGYGADIRYRHAKAPVTRLMYATTHKKGQGKMTDAEIDALRAKRLDFVRFLISRGADPDPMPVKSWYIDSPLMRAHDDNDYELVKLLLESGASPLTPRLTQWGNRNIKCTSKQPCTVGTAFYNDEHTEQRIIDLLIEYENKVVGNTGFYTLPAGASKDPWDWQGW